MKKYRTIWISDIHLGTTHCQADKLLDFLKNVDCDYLFLVGDIVDLWRLKGKSYWPSSHNLVIQKLLRKARHGTKIIYIPGNHDEAIRDYCGYSFGDIDIYYDYTHRLKNGKKIYICHGDTFDIVTRYYKWLARLGNVGYTILLNLNSVVLFIRSLFGLKSHFSLSQFIKFQVKQSVNFISNYESTVIQHVKNMAVDGIVTGHIHHAEIKEIDGFCYMNCGDWVESCTAIVETESGELKLIRWNGEQTD